MFGPHLIIDGSKCNTAKLGDRLLIERILTDYPRAIGMTRIGGPYMFEYQAPDPAYSGVSGIVVIAESHIAIHTFPALDYFTMDIFSCKNFDHEVAIDYIRAALDVEQMDRMLVQRGLSFRGPHHGPLGATDELIAAAAERNEGLGVTIGSIPLNDPLYPKEIETGQMLWPAFGVTPDIGSLTIDGGVRTGATVVPANAAAAGAMARAGLIPIQPIQLNPTASTSGVLDRMTTLGGQGRQMGKALEAWERLARIDGAPVVLAIGPHIVAQGMRDLVTDLIQRGHVSALILEGETMLADAYESLGYRHYLRDDDEMALPVCAEEEWTLAREWLITILAGNHPPTNTATVASQLGLALSSLAPRPGILSAAVRHAVPVFAVGETGLSEVGIDSIDHNADLRALRSIIHQQHAGLVACGTSMDAHAFVQAASQPMTVIALDAQDFADATAATSIDTSVSLPFVVTGLVQRLPQRTKRTQQADTLIPELLGANS